MVTVPCFVMKSMINSRLGWKGQKPRNYPWLNIQSKKLIIRLSWTIFIFKWRISPQKIWSGCCLSEVVGTENIQKVPVSNVPNLIKFRYEPITSNDYQNKIFVNKRLKNKKKKNWRQEGRLNIKSPCLSKRKRYH